MCPGDQGKHSPESISMAAASVVEQRPASPPVVTTNHYFNEEAPQSCRICHEMNTLRVDWAQGDRVCTNCGAVDEGHLLDSRPDWKEYDNDDGAGRTGAVVRSGLVPVDETRYIGGLQPTTLSMYVYGATSSQRAGSAAATRKKLICTNRKMDMLMEKRHAKQLKASRVARTLTARKRSRDEIEHTFTQELRPEFDDLVAVEEQAASQSSIALHSEKWRLERAILLHGTHHEREALDEESIRNLSVEGHKDETMIKAARDLYDAHKLLTMLARKLKLPVDVTRIAENSLCRFASLRDGIKVRGVASTLTRNKKTSAKDKISHQEEQKAVESLRIYNRAKQIGALAAAIVFCTTRNAGHARTMEQVCCSVDPTQMLTRVSNLDVDKKFIKRKHCARAMSELKEVLPEVCQPRHVLPKAASASDNFDTQATVNFIDHALGKLELPPVAQACVRTLVLLVRDEDTKLSTICAASVALVSLMGLTMKKLASTEPTSDTIMDTKTSSDPPEAKKAKLESEVINDDLNLGTSAAEQRAYEMRRVWDAWVDQPSWSRSLTQIEDSCGVSRKVFVKAFRKLFKRRKELLGQLPTRLADGQPLASVLLPHVSTMSPLMKERDLN